MGRGRHPQVQRAARRAHGGAARAAPRPQGRPPRLPLAGWPLSGHRRPAAHARVPRGEPLPLSFGQERLWFLHQLDPGDPSYVVPLLVRFEGPLDAGALERALSALVRRHEVLRTTFALAGDRPVAVIHEAAALGLPRTSFAALPESEREVAARAEFAAELRRPFDLATGPLLRPRLFELSALDHVLLLVAHHIVTDGQTSDVLRREIGALHAAFAAGLPSPLEDLSPSSTRTSRPGSGAGSPGRSSTSSSRYWRARLAGGRRGRSICPSIGRAPCAPRTRATWCASRSTPTRRGPLGRSRRAARAPRRS